MAKEVTKRGVNAKVIYQQLVIDGKSGIKTDKNLKTKQPKKRKTNTDYNTAKTIQQRKWNALNNKKETHKKHDNREIVPFPQEQT